MAQLIDWLITGAIVSVSMVLAIRYLAKLVHPPKHLQATCIACDTGCEMSDIRDEYHKKQARLTHHKV